MSWPLAFTMMSPFSIPAVLAGLETSFGKSPTSAPRICATPAWARLSVCASLCANDPLRHGEVEAERIADRENPITDPRHLVVAERHRRKVSAVNLDDGDVGGRISTDNFRVELASIGEDHRHLVRVGDDVI